MHRLLAFLSLVVSYAAWPGSWARAQQPANAGAPNAAATLEQPATTIRTTTRLVQVSVVVTDKKGAPITGLKSEDFAVFDQSNPQEIAFFSGASPAPAAPAQPLPKNAFTNRYDLKGQVPGAVTVVLFDSLNTTFADQAYVREQAIKFLKSLKPQDHVAIYALTTKLLLLHEFTQDASALVKAASQFQPLPMSATNPQFYDLPAGNQEWQAWSSVSEAAVSQAEERLDYRARTTTEAFRMIANHVAAIPARKNLVWVSASFPLWFSMGTVNVRDGRIGALTKEAGSALNRANMAIYPVDAKGVQVDPSFSAANQQPTGDNHMSEMLSAQAAERMLADITGGQAFYDNNDIAAGVRKAFDDARYAYTIGFYPNHGQWNGEYRKISIRTNIKGAQLRYRAGYFAEAGGVNSDEARTMAAMREAAMSPLDATGLGMVVDGKLEGAAAGRKIELHIALDPKQLLMQDTGSHQKRAVDLYFVQRDVKGEIVAAGKQRFRLDLDEKQYENLAKAGLLLTWHLTISPQATEACMLVRDAGSGALGSVTMPVQALFEGPGNSARPIKREHLK
jgi:VWFA-related protein